MGVRIEEGELAKLLALAAGCSNVVVFSGSGLSAPSGELSSSPSELVAMLEIVERERGDGDRERVELATSALSVRQCSNEASGCHFQA